MKGYAIYNSSVTEMIDSGPSDLYAYRVHIGPTFVPCVSQNSYWYINGNAVFSEAGSVAGCIDSNILCVEIFGYRPETRSSTFSKLTDLPYINGCSTKQLINATRSGDPTWQMLWIPPYTSEQKHHIHSTSRIVYVHQGRGTSHVGASGKTIDFELVPGMILILDKMIPHHFSTEDEGLIVLPLHIFSSSASEYNHPMFNGTYKTE